MKISPLLVLILIFIQLLQKGYKHLIIYNPIKKQQLEAPPWHYVLSKSLLGDKSDNIPRLLSPKKAIKVINSPELLKEFLSNHEQLCNFNRNRELIELRLAPDEEIILKDGQRNFEALKQEFERMDFQSITNEVSWEKYVRTFDCIRY
jgi:5'-3' exonuclease